MPHSLRRNRKRRGTRTQGYGRVGQHRKSGSKGYRKPGRHKSGWTYILRYEPDYFGKTGFTSPQSLKLEGKTINLREVEELAVKLAPKRKTGDTKIFVDLEKMGYGKLLGKGKVTIPLTVKVPSCSESALRKIEEAGGEIQTEVSHEEKPLKEDS